MNITSVRRMPVFILATFSFLLLSLPALASSPTITSISPNSGPDNISPYPVIKGTNFESGVQVYVNGTVARGAWLSGSTYISFEPPLTSVVGPVSVEVVNPDGGTATLANGWTYTAVVTPPTITAISPNSGPDTISPYPTMTGTNFESGMQVYVNGVVARGVWLSGTTIAVFEPPLTTVTGPVPVEVVNPDGGTATLANGFTYTVATTTSGDTFPRLAYFATGAPQTYDATYQADAAKVHLAVIGGSYEGWGSTLKYDKEAVISSIKGQTKVGTRVFQYVDLNEMAFLQSNSGFSTYWTAVTNNNWWVYNSGTSGTMTPDAQDSTNTKGLVNMATYTDDPTTGLGPYAWGANYVNNLFHLGTYTGKGDATPDLDGFFLDNVLAQPVEGGDWLRNNTFQQNTDSTVGTAFRTGEKTFFTEMASIWPAGIQLANMGLPTTATFTPLTGAMQGGMDEAAIGANWSYETWSGAATMQAVYKNTYDNTGGPQYLLFGHAHLQANGVDAITYDSNANPLTYSPAWQGMRYGLAACLMGNGYYAATSTVSYAEVFLWFDEFDNAGAGVGYLGQAIDPWQTTSWMNGVWKREYQNGIVLWNPKGNGTQTVSLSGLGNLKHINGTEDPTINNGASVTNGSVTLNDRDGLILLRY